MQPATPIGYLRRHLGTALFERVAGTDGLPARQQIYGEPGPRWFQEGSPITIVHADSAMFVAGLRALLLQSLHPLAMAGVAEHSDYRGDPWGRLARTSYFLAATTYGTEAVATGAVRRVRAVHSNVEGVAPDGRRYAASDPRLLRWVHVAEVDSFLRAHRRYGRSPLGDEGYDEYVRQMSRIAAALGATDVPTTRGELGEALSAYRPELRGTSEARQAARYMLLQPPLPVVARGPYLALGAAAVAMLPQWARWPLRLPWLPVTEATVVRGAGEVLTRTIRWALPAAAALSRESPLLHSEG